MRARLCQIGSAAVIVLSTFLPASAQLLPQVTEKPKKPQAPKPAQIVIETSPRGQVYLDDAFKGQASPQGRLVIEGPRPGNHTLRVSLSGKRDFERQVTVSAGQATRVDATMVDAETPAGTLEVNSKDGLKYAWIPAGTFQMGCSPGDSECVANEKPPHQINLSKGFWIGQTDVTVGAYRNYASFLGASLPASEKSDQHPIVNISWDDAVGYCGWAGGRLPTEAEWEYAARGGSTEPRYGPLEDVAWYDKDSGSEWHAVGQKRANGFGLFDMLGNVWQWTADWADVTYYNSSPMDDPPGASTGTTRILRGGSWFNTELYSRVTFRNWAAPTLVNSTYGFRCVTEIAPSNAAKYAANFKPVVPKHPVEVNTSNQNTSSARVNPRDGLRYIWIPSGTFLMGCSPGDAECYDSEKPLHKVTLTKGFWIGQTDVTVSAYKKYAAATGVEVPPSQMTDQHPVVNISWNDAAAYCRWAGGRLPLESEWEYAARGGSTENRYGPLDDIAWYDMNSGNEWHEVGQKRPNAFGLFDMLGDVWQWVDSWWDPNYYKSSPSVDPPGPAASENRVMRGGSWFNTSLYSRASMRNFGDPSKPNTTFGIRCIADKIGP